MTSSRDQKIELVKQTAMKCLNDPYIWGGNHPLTGMDCSGFVQWCLASVGLDPKGDQTAQRLYNWFIKNGLLGVGGPGALVFYGKGLSDITHCSIMLTDSHIIEAGGGNAKCTSREQAAKYGAMIRIRPLKNRADIQAIIMPNYASGGT